MSQEVWAAAYAQWFENVPEDRNELRSMTSEQVKDAFGKTLHFGTGGLRGEMGAGTNRMNCHTVAQASRGVAQYLLSQPLDEHRIAIAYDTRMHSSEFSMVAAKIFASAGMTVYRFSEPMPTPMLSFAVRYYGCCAGIVITASHNPAKDNGYKVYGPDGCQITTTAADQILACIQNTALFRSDEYPGSAGSVLEIGDDCINAYYREVKKIGLSSGEQAARNFKIIYTPLNGTGFKPMLHVLRDNGFSEIIPVPEQSAPDGRFLTCPYPNPEIREALALGLRLAETEHADLLLATDPDADRVGTAVRDGSEMRLISGNEMGLLLLDYIINRRRELGCMPDRPLIVKSIVSTNLAETIAKENGVAVRNVLTGFKYIGEQIGQLEAAGEKNRFLFGFEESYGYLAGSYVRDKDGIGSALLICEMFAFYRGQGLSLADVLRSLYAKYGYCLNTLHSFLFEGADGFQKMKGIMEAFRKKCDFIGNRKILSVMDYMQGIDGLPVSDVLKFTLQGGITFLLRPSGTEPKLKFYFSITAGDQIQARKMEWELLEKLKGLLGL